MKTVKKASGYREFFWDTLRYKPVLTIFNILCNAGIFAHAAAVDFLARLILNQLETGVRGSVFTEILYYLVLILVVSLARVAVIMVCAVLDGRRSYYYQNRMRLNLFKRLFQREDIVSVTGNSGRIFEVLDDDIPACVFPPELFTEVTGYGLYTIIAMGMLLAINWQVTVFLFLPLSGAIFFVQKMSENRKERRKTNREAHDDVSAFMSDVADSILTIKTARVAGSVLSRFSKKCEARREAILRDVRYNIKVEAVLSIAVNLGVVIMMLAAMKLMTGDSFRIGDFSIFVASMGALGDCVSRIAELLGETKKAEVSYERILNTANCFDHALFLADAEIALKGEVKTYAAHLPRIPLEVFAASGLTFAHDGGGGLRGISLTVRPGELIVIAGAVGSGKSTLLDLLSGSRKPDGGELTWNGKAVADWNEFLLPPNVSSASQKNRFFSGSAMENICLGEAIPDERLRRAARIAALDIPLSNEIGSRGERLSGGQRQRLALARMFAHDAQLYVADDCSSALDKQTLVAVRDNLRTYLKEEKRAMILASNLEPLLRAADEILFLKQGELAARGSFTHLISTCKEFSAVIC